MAIIPDQPSCQFPVRIPDILTDKELPEIASSKIVKLIQTQPEDFIRGVAYYGGGDSLDAMTREYGEEHGVTRGTVHEPRIPADTEDAFMLGMAYRAIQGRHRDRRQYGEGVEL